MPHDFESPYDQDIELVEYEAEYEPAELTEELLVEEVSIDGMCGVY